MIANSSGTTSSPSEEKGCKNINGTRLYYEIKGAGHPIVFIHGFTLDHRMWDNQFHYFSKWYKCIRYDMRGFGQSSLPGTEPYSHQQDLRSLLLSLDINEPVILAGHSAGGSTALNFALQYPRFTRALILSTAAIEGYFFKEFNIEPIYSYARRKSIEYARRKWLAHELFTSARKNKLVIELLDQMIHFYSGWHFVSKDPVVAFEPATWDELANIIVPTLVVYGELDLPDFKEMGDTAAKKIPGARKVIIENAGYLANMENPVLFNEELQQFLDFVSAD